MCVAGNERALLGQLNASSGAWSLSNWNKKPNCVNDKSLAVWMGRGSTSTLVQNYTQSYMSWFNYQTVVDFSKQT